MSSGVTRGLLAGYMWLLTTQFYERQRSGIVECMSRNFGVGSVLDFRGWLAYTPLSLFLN